MKTKGEKLKVEDFKKLDSYKKLEQVKPEDHIHFGGYLTQRLLEHSTPQLTNDVYTNVDPALRQAIECLPVAEWL